MRRRNVPLHRIILIINGLYLAVLLLIKGGDNFKLAIHFFIVSIFFGIGIYYSTKYRDKQRIEDEPRIED